MKIIIYDAFGDLKFNPNTMRNAGVGSLKIGIIELAQQLAKKGHHVKVYVQCNTPDLYDDVEYYDVSSYVPEQTDVLIGVENFPKEYSARKVVNWFHRNNIEHLSLYPKVDQIVLLSEWQREFFKLPSYFDEKVVVIGHGIDLQQFNQNESRIPNTVIHVGFPTKGMQYLPSIFEKVRNKLKEKNVALHVYGGGWLWGWDDKQFRTMYDRLIHAGIKFHGQYGRETITKQLKKHMVFLYPSTFAETFGLPVLEALAAGCPVICSSEGNLSKLVDNGSTGFIIEGNPGEYLWHEKAADKIVYLLKENYIFETMSKSARNSISKFSWENVIKEWEERVLRVDSLVI